MAHSAGDEPVAVVPLKALHQAKSRLAAHLDPRHRRELAAWMFAQVVSACRGASLLGDVLVVAGDDAAAALARELRVEVLVEPAPGLAAAIGAADRALAGAPASLVVAADLPLARAGDLEAVCRVGARGPCVVVAPTRDGGTAALLRRPPGLVRPDYGPGSAAAHLRAGERAGAHAARVDLAALAFDVDTADHLRMAGTRDRRMAQWADGLSAG